jgi:uncharacterized coiled-coil protein SlyX
MTQLVQLKPSVSSIGATDFLAGSPIASKNDEFTLHTEDVAVKMLEAELQEHRYYLEQKVEQRTVQLARRITLLESCNATLADKLAQARREISVLHKQLANCVSELKSDECTSS